MSKICPKIKNNIKNMLMKQICIQTNMLMLLM